VLRTGLALVTMLAATVLVPALDAGGAATPPNVLVILTDDQRPGTLSVMPETRRWFRKHGVAYPNAHATTPLCCPARASLLTGKYAHNHGVETNHDVAALDFASTVPRYLRDAGYTTAYAGKFLNGWEADPPHFDRWATFASPWIGHGYTGARFNVDGVTTTVESYSTDYIRRWSVRFVETAEADDDRPWFLMVAPYAPHLPATPAKKFEDAPVPKWNPSPAVLEKDRSDKPPHVNEAAVKLAAMKTARRNQLRSLMSVDVLVARLMETLASRGENADTLAFFTTDNGFLWGDHGLRGKRYPYTFSRKVPMLARWPGHLVPGTVDVRLTANVDIPATILDAAGVIPDAPLDGRSVVDPWQRDRLFLEYMADPDAGVPSWRSIVTKDVHYVEYLDGEEITFREYYDLEGDPWQLVNLLGDADTSNDPPPEMIEALGAQAELDAGCSGTDGPQGCP
jgi:arylsulfatase A-like enzyme